LEKKRKRKKWVKVKGGKDKIGRNIGGTCFNGSRSLDALGDHGFL